MKETKLIKWSSIIHLTGRVLVFANLCFLYKLGGFFEEGFLNLLRTLTPITVFYFTAFTIYAVKYPYPFALKKMKRADKATLPVIISGYVLYFALITISALNPNLINFSTLIDSIWIGEVVFAMLAATSLPNIMKRFPLQL